MRAKGLHGAVVLLHLFAVFPEDATIPCAVLDALSEAVAEAVAADEAERCVGAPATAGAAAAGAAAAAGSSSSDCGGLGGPSGASGGGGTPSGLPAKPPVRKWLLQLVSHSMLQGSIQAGLGLHDLMRDYLVAFAGAERLRATQRAVLAVLLKALDTPATATADSVSRRLDKYARRHIGHHLHGAIVPEASLLEDELLFGALLHHPADWLKAAAARAIGARALRRAAEVASGKGEPVLSGQMWLEAAVVDPDGGACRRTAWRLLRRVDPVTPASVELEARAIRGLLLNSGGIAIGSYEHKEANARLGFLMATDAGAANARVEAAHSTSLSQLRFQQLQNANSAHARDGFLELYHALFALGGVRTATKLGASDGAGRACAALQQIVSASALLHTSEGYAWDDDFGAGGAWLRELVAWYDFGQTHAAFKAANGRDVLLSGLGGALLLLHWGDVMTCATDWRAAADGWAQVAGDVRAGDKSWAKFRIDLVDMRASRAVAMAAGRRDVVQQLFDASPEGYAYAHSFGGSAGRDLDAHVQAVSGYMSTWGMACSWTAGSAKLMARCLAAWLLPHDDPDLAEAEAWLPPPEALLGIADAERAWDVFMVGAQHPALLGATLYFRLAKVDAAIEVVQGLLVRLVHPLTRFECWRLLAQCQVAQEQPAAEVCKPLRNAINEARRAGHLWLELLAMRELHRHGGCPYDEFREVAVKVQLHSMVEEVAAFMPDPETRSDWQAFLAGLT